VTPDYPPWSSGGGAKIARNLVCSLAERGHEVTVLTGYYEYRRKSVILVEQKDNVKIVWLPYSFAWLVKVIPPLRYSLPPSLRSVFHCARIRYEDFDVIHLFGFPSHLLVDLVAILARSRPKLLTIHAFPKYAEREGKASVFLKVLYRVYLQTIGRHVVNSAKVVTAVSRFTMEECIKNGIPKDKIVVIENGIDLNDYKPVQYSDLEAKFGINGGDILILSISRITWHKGYEYALKSVSAMVKKVDKPVKYMIVGPVEDPNYYLSLEKELERLGLRETVIFAGLVSHNLKLQALSRADIFLAPSVHEGFGLTILEAMAMGKPIVASDCEGFRTVVDHMKDGILVQPGNPEEMTDAILVLLTDPDTRDMLSKSALSKVREYAWQKRVTAYEELYYKCSGRTQ